MLAVISGTNRYDALTKVAAAYGSITSAVAKFQTGDPQKIVAGVSDIVTGISVFLPQPCFLHIFEPPSLL